MLDKTNPLWLPPGSVRSLIALIVVGTTMALFVSGNAPDGLVAIAGAIIGFYFTQRAEGTNGNGTVEPLSRTIVK